MSIQVEIFEYIRSRRNNTIPYVQELEKVLSVSTDSVYRRLRGDTVLTLEELSKICEFYGISSNKFIKGGKNHVNFEDKWSVTGDFSYTSYLRQLHSEMQILKDREGCRIFYSSKDIPVFYNFLIPEISEFKGFFWEKTIVQLPSHRNKLFSVKEKNEERSQLAQEIIDIFNQTSTSELWNDEVLTSTLRQIKFYYESDFFESQEDVEILIEKLFDLVNHFEHQADIGTKFRVGTAPKPTPNNFLLYYSDVLIGDNTVILDLGQKKIVYKAHNIIDNLFSDDDEFCNRAWTMHENFLNSATLISVSSQKERRKFFKGMKKGLLELKKQISEE